MYLGTEHFRMHRQERRISVGWAKPWSFIENHHIGRNREWLDETEDILKRIIFAFAEITLSLQRGFGIYGFRRRSLEHKWI